MDELRDVLDGVDVVVRGRADQAHAGGRVTDAGDLFGRAELCGAGQATVEGVAHHQAQQQPDRAANGKAYRSSYQFAVNHFLACPFAAAGARRLFLRSW